MSFIYDISKALQEIGEAHESKFTKKAQAAPAPLPTDAGADARALALKLVQNLRHQLSPQAAKDSNLYAKDMKSLRAFLDYAYEQKLGDVTGALLVMAGDTTGTNATLGKGADFATLTPEEKKSYVQFTDGQVVYQVHKDGFVSYLKGLQQRAGTENNKIAEVMLGKIIDEANQKLKLGVDKNEQVLDLLPQLIQLDKTDTTRGTAPLKNTDLKDQPTVLKMLEANKLQHNTDGKSNAFDANMVCKFLEWLLRRAQALGNKAYVDAVTAVYSTCSVPHNVPGGQSNQQPQGGQAGQQGQAGQGGMAEVVRRSLGGDPLDGNVLDLNKIYRFFTKTKESLTSDSATFNQMMLTELGLDSVKDPVFQQKQANLENRINAGIEFLQYVMTLVNTTRIFPDNLKPTAGNDLRTFISAVMKPNMVSAAHAEKCLEALMKLVNMVYEVEEELIRYPSWLHQQNQHKMGWLGLLQSVYNSANIAMQQEVTKIRR